MCSDLTFWCVHVSGKWAQCPMCAWKCAVSQLSYSLHIYMHTSDTQVTARLMRACKCAVIRLSDVFEYWAVSPITDVCMKMCSETIVLLSAHLHAHVRHTGHCTLTCTWCVHINVLWFDYLMCSCNWEVSPMADVCMNMYTDRAICLTLCTFTCTRQTHGSLHVYMQLMRTCKRAVIRLSDVFYMHTSDTRVTAPLLAPDVCL